ATGFTTSSSVDTPAGGGWLSATASNLTTPATITVMVDPTGLASGQYTGSVKLTAAGSTSQTVTVNLMVPMAAGGNIILGDGGTLGSLSFSAQAGGAPPPAQQVVVSDASGSSGIAIAFGTS